MSDNAAARKPKTEYADGVITPTLFKAMAEPKTPAEESERVNLLKELYTARTVIQQRKVCDLIRVLGIPAVAFGRVIGMDATYLSKILSAGQTKDQRLFTMPYTSMVKLCDLYLNCTLGEFLTGVKWRVRAPIMLDAYVSLIPQLSQEQLKEVAAFRTALLQKQPPLSDAGIEVFRERLTELAHDEARLAAEQLRKNCNNNIQAALKGILAGSRADVRETTVLYLCCAAELSPDYLLRRDYSSSDILLKDGKLLPRSSKSMAADFLALSSENQIELLAKIIMMT